MKILIILCSAIASSVAGPIADLFSDEWLTFKADHGKAYKNSFEELYRMNIFKENKLKIDQHNEKYQKNLVKFSMKMNHFGDLTHQEFKSMMNGYKKIAAQTSQKSDWMQYTPDINESLPRTVDWRNKNAVTPVKDQGQCGSCWAFSATGSLEGQLAIKTGKLIAISEQNLIDCSGKYGNMGCNGGLMDNAFQYIKDNGGIDTESSYPYRAVADYTCHFKKGSIAGTDVGYVDLKQGDEGVLQSAVAQIGPISVAIDASNMSFQFYSKGIYDEEGCSATQLDHGVLAVGYGTENGQDYWLVKNSWSSSWGDKGYIKMSRNRDNQCGIATSASYPLV